MIFFFLFSTFLCHVHQGEQLQGFINSVINFHNKPWVNFQVQIKILLSTVSRFPDTIKKYMNLNDPITKKFADYRTSVHSNQESLCWKTGTCSDYLILNFINFHWRHVSIINIFIFIAFSSVLSLALYRSLVVCTFSCIPVWLFCPWHSHQSKLCTLRSWLASRL